MITDKQSNQAAAHMERYYMRLKRNNIHISLEDIEDTEWMWSNKEVANLKILWNRDAPMVKIAEILRRSEIAVFFQVLDLLYKKKIKPRDWNVW